MIPAAALLILKSAAAQDLTIPEVSYPVLPRQADTAEGFVPLGWGLEAQASGDLNRDGEADFILVIRQNNPNNILKDFEGLGEKPFDTNPRILAVAFRNKVSGNYSLRLENHTLIPRRSEPAAEDPFDSEFGIAIVRDGFQVNLSWFMTAGGWETSNTTYTFRYKGRGFELIGYDRSTTHRGSGDTKAISINYLTRKVKATASHISSDAAKIQWRMLPQRPPVSILSIGNGLSFAPES